MGSGGEFGPSGAGEVRRVDWRFDRGTAGRVKGRVAGALWGVSEREGLAPPLDIKHR